MTDQQRSATTYMFKTDEQQEQEQDLNSPTHPRKCCPYNVRTHDEYSDLLWCDLFRTLFGIALLIMKIADIFTPLFTSTWEWNWLPLLMTFTLVNLIFLLAATSLSGIWFQRGRAISHLFGPYIEFIIIQFINSVIITAGVSYIVWNLDNASPLTMDETFAWIQLTTPIKYRAYSIWNVTSGIFISLLILGLGQIFRIYLSATITPGSSPKSR